MALQDGENPGIDDQPSIYARKSILPNDWYVMISWPDGRQDRVNGFISSGEATEWIAEESAKWMARRTAIDGWRGQN